jgi:DNA-binding LacI/PurR family transcriptional regulator
MHARDDVLPAVRSAYLPGSTACHSQLTASGSNAWLAATATGQSIMCVLNLLHVRCVACRKQHNVNLPGDVSYSAVDNSQTGAPLRPTTVQDAIEDLPPISNGDQE